MVQLLDHCQGVITMMMEGSGVVGGVVVSSEYGKTAGKCITPESFGSVCCMRPVAKPIRGRAVCHSQIIGSEYVA